ncbi:predicted protein [Nematostella vectensis]|uniref:HECT-type E3 ubiquitin transferase n=1 Tax=Nematostella vectensis TaxID=45351 RepID=A7SNF7_NEMVE|nr:predicted protein [Nematostella vectensis]|eukprot:XP_001626891.1 predicted protein [Nematostella vectensis]
MIRDVVVMIRNGVRDGVVMICDIFVMGYAMIHNGVRDGVVVICDIFVMGYAMIHNGVRDRVVMICDIFVIGSVMIRNGVRDGVVMICDIFVMGSVMIRNGVRDGVVMIRNGVRDVVVMIGNGVLMICDIVVARVVMICDIVVMGPLPNAYFARFTKDVGQKGVDAGKAGGKANFTTADQEGSTQTNIGGTVAAGITETSHSQTASGITECADNGCLTTRETASCSNEELLVPVDRIDAINADRSASIIPGEIGNNLGDQEADAVVAGSFRADSGRSLDEELIDICVVTSLVVAGTSSLGNRQAVEHVTENCSDSELMAAVMMEQEVDQELVSDLTPANRDNETIDSQENDGDQKTDNAVTRESLEGVFRRTDQGVSGMVDQGNSGSIDQQGSHASETMSLGADQATEGGDLPRNTNITQSIISETELHSSLHSSSVAGNPEDQEKTWMKCEEWNPETNVSVALRLKLRQLRLIGRLIGAAICDDLLLSLHLSKPFVKQILGIPLSHPDDLSSFDHELHSNQITWVQENSVDDLGFTFSIDATNPWTGRPVTIDLSENPDEELTDSNKSEYVKLVSQFKLQDSIAAEVKELAGGLNEVVPQDLLSFFTADEFSLLINGVSKIDVQDWRANTLYRGCKESDEIITWLWKTIASLKEEEKALLLKFSTGSPCVPIGGFAALQGLSGANKFTVSKIMGVNKIPEASTCFNLLKLTNYESEKQLREKLLIAIRHGSEGFSFA